MKILVAGSAALPRPVTQSFLDRSECEVLLCAGGRETVELAEKERPDLIVLGDVEDPGPVDCWRQLQATASTADLPVLLVVGRADRDTVPDGAAQADLDDPGQVVDEAARLLSVRRRAQKRRSLKVRVDFYGSDREYVGHTRDVSESGMFLRSDASLDPGDRLQLIFDIPVPGGATIRAAGEVVRRQTTPGPARHAIGLGIRFHKVGERDREAIAALVDELPRDSA